MWTKTSPTFSILLWGVMFVVNKKKGDARDFLNFTSICHSMKFDSLIITIGGVRFRQCHCEKILEKYNKWQVNIPKESSDLDGRVFLNFQLEGKTP